MGMLLLVRSVTAECSTCCWVSLGGVVDDEGNCMDEALGELEWHEQDPLANIDDLWGRQEQEDTPVAPTEPVVLDMDLTDQLFDCGQTVNSSKTVGQPEVPANISVAQADDPNQVDLLRRQLAEMTAKLAALENAGSRSGDGAPGQGG